MRTADARTRLLAEQASLLADANASRQSRASVELDQTRIGRLSRMDALQQQSMAKAEQARRLHALARIDAALGRIETDEYGDCIECGQAIAEPRMALDPAVTLCIGCAQARESAR